MSHPTLYDLGGPPENIQLAQAVFQQDARGRGLIPGGMADVNLCDDSGGDRNKLDESEIEEWFEGLK